MLALRTFAAFAAILAASCWTCLDSTGQAAEPSHQQTYLGIGVEPLSPALASQLHESIVEGQGLVVTDVADTSPAKKSGLQVHDTLMTYGDQRLFSVKQLIGLLRLDYPGHVIGFSIVRDGKPMSVYVTLGKREAAHGAAAAQFPELRIWELPDLGWFTLRQDIPHHLTAAAPTAAKPNEWESFDSMNVKKLGKDQFQVEIQYLNTKGKTDRVEFKGSREEIHKAIVARTDLPAEERGQLLRSLDLPMTGPTSLASRIESDFNQLWNEEFRGRMF
jgi:hypothetical protein